MSAGAVDYRNFLLALAAVARANPEICRRCAMTSVM